MLRKSQVDVDALYTEDKSGPYFFTSGFNMIAIISALIGSVFSSFLPIWGPASYDKFSPYGWFLGVLVAGIVYFALNGGKTPHKK